MPLCEGKILRIRGEVLLKFSELQWDTHIFINAARVSNLFLNNELTDDFKQKKLFEFR